MAGGHQPEGKVLGTGEESLKILETAEGQTNAVFAMVGSAVQKAQFFERALARFLLTYNKVSSDPVSIKDIDDKLTMGRLLANLRKKVTVPDAWESSLPVALKDRNFVSHRLFLERGGQLGSVEGRLQLLEDLWIIGEKLDACTTLVNAMRLAMCRSLGIEDELVEPEHQEYKVTRQIAVVEPCTVDIADLDRG